MDWLKLFALLVAVASVIVTAEGTRKKIRIHIPQKVKHIHHHKKIYITNHPASSQYAPAYLPTAEGALAMPTAVVPAAHVAGLLPLKPMPLFEERGSKHLQTMSTAASSILPMYQARGFYGPTPDWEEQEFDLVPPPGPSGPTASAYLPTAFSEPSAPATSSSYPTKRMKVVKVREPSRKKKIIRKRKPKRVLIQEVTRDEEPHPISTYHEQFYADVEGAGTIRKIKKPKRVEKIIDGDTEHIHTYSEEHIHKLVFDDSPKLTGIAGADPTASMSVLTSAHSLIPVKNPHSLLSLDPTNNSPLLSDFGAFSEFGPVGSMGTPSHMEYIGYNPRDVTHDHVFHDHGEIPSSIELAKDTLGFPPKASYNSQGYKIHGSNTKSRHKNKFGPSYHVPQPTKPAIDFSFYENMYTTTSRPRKPQRPFKPSSSSYNGENSSEFDKDPNDFRPIPYFRFKEKSKTKNHEPTPISYYGHNSGHLNGYRQGQASVSVPFSTSSSFAHDRPFKQHKNSYVRSKPITGAGFSNFKDAKDPFTSFKDIYTNNFEYDAYASSSNLHGNDNEQSPWPLQGKGKKKSVSTQNISFGGQDHKTTIDHMADTSDIENSVNQNQRPPFNNFVRNEKRTENVTPSSLFTITDHSPIHEYYTAMALKAFQDDPMSVPEASNNNFQIVEAPSTPLTETEAITPLATTMQPTPTFIADPSRETTTENPSTGKKLKRSRSRIKQRHHIIENPERRQKLSLPIDQISEQYRPRQHGRRVAMQRMEQSLQKASQAIPNIENRQIHNDDSETPTARGKLKYGDKL